MQIHKIKIAEKTLSLLKKKSWDNIKFEEIVGNLKNKIKLKNKNELINNINRYVDYLLKKETNNIEKSTPKDMLFEVIMARFDILQRKRESYINLYESFKYQPQKTIVFIPSFLESIILTISLANIKITGIKGSLFIKVTFIIYIITFFQWINDNTTSLEKTMTSLDKYLEYSFKIKKWIK